MPAGHALLIILAVLGAASCRDAHAPIRIGVAGPFSNATGTDNLHGVQMAVAETNARGGIDGRPLELVVADDSARGDKAALVADQFIKDPTVVAVVGHLTSASMLAAAQLYDGQLAAVSTMATAPALTDISPWVFRVTASDAVLGTDLARFAASQHWQRLAVLYQNDSWGRALSSAFEAAYTRTGGTLVSADPISPTNVVPPIVDFSVFLRTYRKSRPDAVMFISSGTEIGLLFLQDVAASGLHVPVLGSDGMSPQRFMTEETAQGLYIPSSFLADDSSAVASAFRARFRAQHGHEADMYAALGYDAALAVIAAIRNAGADRSRVRAALASSAKAPVQGVTGPISFLSGDRQQRFGGMVHIENHEVRTHLHWSDVSRR